MVALQKTILKLPHRKKADVIEVDNPGDIQRTSLLFEDMVDDLGFAAVRTEYPSQRIGRQIRLTLQYFACSAGMMKQLSV